jgi:hypothetical protein
LSRERARTQFAAAEARWDSEGGALEPRHPAAQDLGEAETVPPVSEGPAPPHSALSRSERKREPMGRVHSWPIP